MNIQEFETRKNLSEREILTRLNIKMNMYNLMQFNTAVIYLEKLLGAKNPTAYRLQKNPLFWAWWKIRYVCFNEKFIASGGNSIKEYHRLQSTVTTYPPECVYSAKDHRLKVFKHHLNHY